MLLVQRLSKLPLHWCSTGAVETCHFAFREVPFELFNAPMFICFFQTPLLSFVHGRWCI